VAIVFAATCVPRSVEDHEIQLGRAHAIGPPPVAVREAVELHSVREHQCRKETLAGKVAAHGGEFSPTWGFSVFLRNIFDMNLFPKTCLVDFF
jgi:hypothetical protein